MLNRVDVHNHYARRRSGTNLPSYVINLFVNYA
jgi:hypothetical protein